MAHGREQGWYIGEWARKATLSLTGMAALALPSESCVTIMVTLLRTFQLTCKGLGTLLTWRVGTEKQKVRPGPGAMSPHHGSSAA